MLVSRSAASGLTRLDLMAGATAASTVTRVPTTMPMSTVRGFSTKPELGSPPPPNVCRSSLITRATPIPAATPTAEATTPTARASINVDPRICPRDAPNVRSMAISLVRCATTIENELEITKMLTKSATTAKAEKNVLMNPKIRFTNDSCSFCNVVPVITSICVLPVKSRPRTAPSTDFARASSDTPLSPRTRIDWAKPGCKSSS